MVSSIFICQLSESKQNKIKNLIREIYTKEGYDNKVIEEIVSNAMDDRLCNLEEIMDITEFLN